VKRTLLIALAAALLGGCGDESATDTTTTTAAETSTARVYFLRDGKVWPVARNVEGPRVAAATVNELGRGPSDAERSELGLSTALPSGGAQLSGISLVNGVAHYGASSDMSRGALAQVVYTLTQFPTVKKVEIDGKTYTRADFEDQTPAILVESPLPFADVSSPIRATGTANTFEATFNYELTDTDGKIVDENFVTATSGTGTRGTFDFTTKKFTVPFDGVGSLVVFERSAEDGSRTKLVEIPLRMSQ
jgi:hypothetical protein